MESKGLSFHWFSSWQECRRKFYFQRVAHLEGNKKSLAIGTLIHEALAAQRAEPGSDAGEQILVHGIELLPIPDPDELKALRMKVMAWYKQWLLHYGLEIAEPEVTLTTVINGLELSGTLDAIITAPDGTFIVEDIKTSSYSTDLTLAQRNNDQWCQYALLVAKVDGVKPMFRINAVALRNNIPPVDVSEPFPIDDDRINGYFEGLWSLNAEITEHLEAFAAGAPLARCFPRNTSFCGAFGCPFEHICANNPPDIRIPQSAPIGFSIIADDARVPNYHWR